MVRLYYYVCDKCDKCMEIGEPVLQFNGNVSDLAAEKPYIFTEEATAHFCSSNCLSNYLRNRLNTILDKGV